MSEQHLRGYSPAHLKYMSKALAPYRQAIENFTYPKQEGLLHPHAYLKYPDSYFELMPRNSDYKLPEKLPKELEKYMHTDVYYKTLVWSSPCTVQAEDKYYRRRWLEAYKCNIGIIQNTDSDNLTIIINLEYKSKSTDITHFAINPINLRVKEVVPSKSPKHSNPQVSLPPNDSNLISLDYKGRMPSSGRFRISCQLTHPALLIAKKKPTEWESTVVNENESKLLL